LYHVDLSSEESGDIITDIAVQNPGGKGVKLPATGTIVI
jgi:hypothetical protein